MCGALFDLRVALCSLELKCPTGHNQCTCMAFIGVDKGGNGCVVQAHLFGLLHGIAPILTVTETLRMTTPAPSQGQGSFGVHATSWTMWWVIH